MIKRESYMSRIRPFIGGELVKVMTGIRRAGKSVMLELVKEELLASGIRADHFISINFEDLRYAQLLNASAPSCGNHGTGRADRGKGISVF